jgi:hypothetical protein
MVAPRQRGSPCTTAMFLPQEVPTNRCGTAIFRPRRASCPHRPFRPLQASEALLYAPRRGLGFALFLGSSAVEHSTVNRMVAGSNPARGANQINRLSKHPYRSRIACVGAVLANPLPCRHGIGRGPPADRSATTPGSPLVWPGVAGSSGRAIAAPARSASAGSPTRCFGGPLEAGAC